ncbi:transposase [Curvibacter sp. HBC28]|uniref:Transposase n=1 Tax=Curvibacter microcysteis TaxID=3026419 RepID=A0ABT5MEE5_9BURK|nr:transposase [Curvibacter sp. HBC28]MDD0814369.1 transposase [Curvibacter sp. HBC28]
MVLDILRDRTTVAEAHRADELNPSEVEQLVDEGKRGMENALRSKPLEIKLSDLQQAHGEALLKQLA